ncbi:MAG TPA: ATP-binding protein [Actinomycetota bacterium]|nr:ATP-binding protein [Actinomycetota bacterium]
MRADDGAGDVSGGDGSAARDDGRRARAGPRHGGPTILERRYRLVPHAVTSARRALASLADELPDPVLDDLRLLVSELVGNSVRHARVGPDASLCVRVEVADRSVRVEVTDPGPGFEAPGGDRPAVGASGWGLRLVDRIADRWGVDPGPPSRVWLEIDLARRSSGAGRSSVG